MSDDATWLAFAGRGRDLTVSIAPGLNSTALWNSAIMLLPDWPMREVGACAAVDITIRGTDTDMTLRAESWDGGESHAEHSNDAANALGGLLTDAILAHDMAAHCLHASAVEIAGRAVLFIGPSEAGKSTLALRLVTRGCRLLADDHILLVSENTPYRVAALGLAAKARKPLPPGDGLAGLVDARWYANSDELVYLHLEGDETAAFGYEVPIGAIVIPRRGTAPARTGFHRAAPGEVALTLIRETTSPRGPAVFVPAMTQLAEAVDGYILEYDEGEAAADALLAAFTT